MIIAAIVFAVFIYLAGAIVAANACHALFDKEFPASTNTEAFDYCVYGLAALFWPLLAGILFIACFFIGLGKVATYAGRH